jgi:hypothetical protein
MDTLSQWEKVSYNEWFIYLRIYENTELVDLKTDISKQVDYAKRDLLYPLLVTFDAETNYNEGLYTMKDECGYLRVAAIDKPIVSKKDEKNMTEMLQLVFQIGKQKGHEVVFLSFNPGATTEKYFTIFNTILRTNNGVYKTIYLI